MKKQRLSKLRVAFRKHKVIYISAISIFLAIVIALSIVLPIVLREQPPEPIRYFSAPVSTLPTEDKFALQKYDYSELGNTQTTVRADSMNVVARDLPRAATELLSDDFSLVYDTNKKELYPVYGKTQSGGAIKAANITFDPACYPQPAFNIGTNSATAYAEAAKNAGVSQSQYYSYYKYMFMSQGQHLANEATRRSELTASDRDGVNADFAAWLKKHPAADGQYGRVLGDKNAVKKEITIDPLYRSYHPTGLYLPAGEPVTVKVEGLKAGERFQFIIGVQDSLAWRGGIPSNGAEFIRTETSGETVKYINNSSDWFFKQADLLTATGHFYQCNSESTPFLQSQWARQNGRAPWLFGSFNFSENKTYTIGSAMGGALQIAMGNCYSRVKVTVTGAVETPHYILGTTTPEYFDKYLRNAPGVIGLIDTENGILIGPTGEMNYEDVQPAARLGRNYGVRKILTEEVDKLAMLWHSFLSVNESFTGGVYNRFNKIMFDWHVPAGAAVSLGNYSFAQPVWWFNNATNYRNLLEKGEWGTLHEIGHNHGNSYGSTWGFGDGMEGEVRNNALTLLSYILFCDIGTTIRSGGGSEHGEYANPYNTLGETLRNKGLYADHNNCGYFQALGMYANIMHSFGAEKFYELLYTYKTKSVYAENKRADFAYRCAITYGMNFVRYFNDFYSSKIADEHFTEEQLALIKKLPNYEPISSYYAGTIDGIKTAGDYKVVFGNDITFDLVGRTISTLDTSEKKGFEVISVSAPAHGSIRYNDSEKKWMYSFNKSYNGSTDEFSFVVRLSDGVQHKFTVTMRITYNGTKITSYNNVTAPDWNAAAEYIYSHQPDASVTAQTVGIGTYNTASGARDIRIHSYYWRAPKTGRIRLSAKSDDWARWYFDSDFGRIESRIAADRKRADGKGGNGQTTTYQSAYLDYTDFAEVNVVQGRYYAVRLINVNTGGRGSAQLGYKYDGDATYSDFSISTLYHPDLSNPNGITTYVHEPKFLISKKDKVNLSVTGTDKTNWEVVSAPLNIDGGLTAKETQYGTDPEDPETYGKVIAEREYKKWEWLIDGQTGSMLHTAWRGVKDAITPEKPQEFIIDTKNVSTFNYFTIVTRNQANSFITNCELQISDSQNGGYRSIAFANRESYVGNTITMRFGATRGRFLKLIVKGTTGGTFSVIAELDAGIYSATQRIMPITDPLVFATEGWRVSSQTDSSLPSGCYYTNAEDERLVIKFKGTSISLYAAVNKGYGSVKIRIDDNDRETVSLNSSAADMRKLVFYAENLNNEEHTVEIISLSSSRVALNLIGLPYSAQLLNAPNIYFERALIIALIVFISITVALLAFIICLVLFPKFRRLVLGNRLMQKLDNRKYARRQRAMKRLEKKAGKQPDSETASSVELPSKRSRSGSGDDAVGTTGKNHVEPSKKPIASAPAAKPVAMPTKPAAAPTAPTAKPVAAPTKPVAPTPAAKPVEQPKKPAPTPTAAPAKSTAPAAKPAAAPAKPTTPAAKPTTAPAKTTASAAKSAEPPKKPTKK